MGSYVADMRQLVGSRPLLLVAAGVVVRAPDRTILLQRRADDGLWGLPGGSLELGESLEDAARRELFEETGLIAGELSLIDIYSGAEFFLEYPNGDQAFVVGATFLVEGLAQAAKPDGQEGKELAYFNPNALPRELSSYSRRLLRRCQHIL